MKTINPSTPLRINGERSRTINPSTALRINGECSRTIKFYTLGCKVNQYDTQSLRERFLASGFRESDNGKPADFCLVNTCTVTGRADSDSLGLIRRAKRENPRAKIIVAGCLTELDRDKIKAACPRALIIRNKGRDAVLPLSLGLRNTDDGIRMTDQAITYFKGHTRAFLKIQDGCDNFCSYCKVPLVRGGSRSKPLEQVAAEARRLAENGFKEIVLCGICLGAYGRGLNPKISLVDAVEALEKIPQVSRIRLSSIEAGDVSDALINKMARSKKLCRHLHIPIQSGDDRILKKMHRKYSRAGYLSLVRKIKIKIPGIAITTDCLLGFPGETEEAFGNTCDLVRKIRPLKVHIFPYSERQGVAAEKFAAHKISPATIKERMGRLKKISDDCAAAFRRKFMGRKMQVLMESRVKGNPSFWEGHTDNYIKVGLASGQGLKNKILSVKLKKQSGDLIIGEASRGI